VRGGRKVILFQLSAHRAHGAIFVPAHKKHEQSKIPKLAHLEIPSFVSQHIPVLPKRTNRGERVQVKRHKLDFKGRICQKHHIFCSAFRPGDCNFRKELPFLLPTLFFFKR